MPQPSSSLDSASLNLSIVRLGRPEAYGPFLRRLDAGKPLRLGVFGASVAQHGGCIDQPYKRCMEFDGVHKTQMPWGEPALRPFKGWAVRLLEHVNRSWPHPHHKLNNSALDATPAQTVLPCLFSHLPTQLDIVLLEFGSMAIHLQLASVEAVARRLLMLRPRPLLLFLSVHAWCHAARGPGQPPVRFRKGERGVGGHIYPQTVWAAAEAEATAVCERYGQACLSVHRALLPRFEAQAPGFGIDDLTGPDCLHPLTGRRGVDYVDEILRHWLDTVRASAATSAPASAAASAPRRAAASAALPWGTAADSSQGLPPPLRARNARPPPGARCYSFSRPLSTMVVGKGTEYQTMQPVAWRAAACAAPGVWRADARPHERARPPHKYRVAGESGGRACVARRVSDECPLSRFAERLAAFLRTQPASWFFCGRAVRLGPRPKRSPGVVALVAGATLEATIDTRVLEDDADAADADAHADADADAHAATEANATVAVPLALEYLTSYEGMGAVSLRCLSGCACPTQTIDAHRAAGGGGSVQPAAAATTSDGDAGARVSVYTTHAFSVVGAVGACVLQLQVLNVTSSGGHKFKVRSLTVMKASEATHAEYPAMERLKRGRRRGGRGRAAA